MRFILQNLPLITLVVDIYMYLRQYKPEMTQLSNIKQEVNQFNFLLT